MPTEYRAIYELTLLEWEELRDAANRQLNVNPAEAAVAVEANKLKWMLEALKKHIH